MKRLTLVSLVLLLILVAAVPVYADKPVTGSEDVKVDWEVFDCKDYGNYDFKVQDYTVAHHWWTDHYDKDGNWVKTEWHSTGVDHVYNSNNPDRFAEGHYASMCHIRPAPGEPGWVIVVCTGVDWNIQLPGEGTVFHFSGLEEGKVFDNEWDQFMQLKRAGLDKFDYETLCRYLAE